MKGKRKERERGREGGEEEKEEGRKGEIFSHFSINKEYYVENRI